MNIYYVVSGTSHACNYNKWLIFMKRTNSKELSNFVFNIGYRKQKLYVDTVGTGVEPGPRRSEGNEINYV